MINEFKFVLKLLLMSLFVLLLVIESSGMSWGKEGKNTCVKSDFGNYKDTITNLEEKFLIASAENSLEEIVFSQLAQQNNAMLEIKELAKTIGSTHINNLNKIKALASKNQIIVPSVLNEQANKLYKKLGNKTGSDFDKEYADWIVINYKENVALFEKITLEGGDNEIKSWALTALPELRAHIEQAILCQKKCNKL